MLKYVLLGFLNYTALTGYELEGWINVSTGNFWHAKLSQIYATLKSLEEDSMVTSHVEPQEGKPDKRIYAIADKGRADLQAWLDVPFTEHEVKKDALLLKVFFASPNNKTAILTQLRLQLTLHRQKLAEYRSETPDAIIRMLSQQPELAQNALLWESTRRYGEMYEETYIRWLEETIQQVQTLLPD
jgi:PadR family transcriptional regulator, regulatory protein AphA